jgi:hypothetical protein
VFKSLFAVPIPETTVTSTWSLVILPEREHVCYSHQLNNQNSVSFCQDCEFLLQEHNMYWRPMVVPDLLWLELTIVSLRIAFWNGCLKPPSSVFEYTYLLWWNAFWTLAPVIAIGLFDRIVGACRLKSTWEETDWNDMIIQMMMFLWRSPYCIDSDGKVIGTIPSFSLSICSTALCR